MSPQPAQPAPLTPGTLAQVLVAVGEVLGVQRRALVPRERVVGSGPVVVVAYHRGRAFEGRGETVSAANAACRVALEGL